MELNQKLAQNYLYMEGFRLNDLKRWHKGFERKAADQPAANFVQSSLYIPFYEKESEFIKSTLNEDDPAYDPEEINIADVNRIPTAA